MGSNPTSANQEELCGVSLVKVLPLTKDETQKVIAATDVERVGPFGPTVVKVESRTKSSVTVINSMTRETSVSRDEKLITNGVIAIAILVFAFFVADHFGVFCSTPKYALGTTVGLSGGTATVIAIHINGKYPRYDLVLRNGKVLEKVPESYLER